MRAVSSRYPLAALTRCRRTRPALTAQPGFGDDCFNDSDWISVWPYPEKSGFQVSAAVGGTLSSIATRPVKGVEVVGSETTIRIFDRLIEEWNRHGRHVPWYDDRLVCCVIRPGGRSADEADHIHRVTVPGIAPAGARIIVIAGDPGHSWKSARPTRGS